MNESSKQAPDEQLKGQIQEIEQRLASHEESVVKYFDEMARVTRALEEEEAKKIVLEQQLGDLRKKLSGKKKKPSQEVAKSRLEPKPKAQLTSSEKNEKAKQKQRMQQLGQLVRNSDLFDAEWYLATNPGVKASKKYSQVPHMHYLRFGGFEGRKPCPEFDSAYYLKKYPGVAKAGMNPLVHYLQYGRREGRRISPSLEEAE